MVTCVIVVDEFSELELHKSYIVVTPCGGPLGGLNLLSHQPEILHTPLMQTVDVRYYIHL